MDFIRDILFGEADSPALMTGDDCPELNTVLSGETIETIKEDEVTDAVDSLPSDTTSIAEDISLHLLKSLEKYKTCKVHEGWREMYYRLKGPEYDENSNKTDEMKVEDIFNRSEREFTRFYSIMSSDWKQYDKALEEFVEKLENSLGVSVDSGNNTFKDDEEKILHSTDYSESDFSEREQIYQSDGSQELEVTINQVESLEAVVNQMDEDSLKLVEESEGLKIKLQKLEKKKQKMEAKIEADRQRFIQQVDDILHAEMSRIRTNFANLKKEEERMIEESEALRRKVEENDKKIFSLYKERDEDHERYKTLLFEKNKLYSQKKLVKSKLKSIERKNKYLSGELEEVRVKVEERLAKNEIQHKEHEEKLSCFLKNMDMFKEETEKRLETRVKRLEDINLKLSKDNHELRYKIFDKNLHGIMAMLETKSPQSPQ